MAEGHFPSGESEGARYAAFISYSHADEDFGDWLHKRLEGYRVPSSLVGREGLSGPISRRLGKVFRDRADLSAAHDLGASIRAGLDRAEALIVLCSPRSAQSRYVGEEIRYFKQLGKGQSIFAAIVDGEPHAAGNPNYTAAEECFPPALIYRLNADGSLSPNPETNEPIAADFREGKDGRENGSLKLIAGLIGVELDELVQREKQAERRRRLVANGIAAVMGVLALAALGAGGFAFVQRNAAVEAQREAERQRDEASRQRSEAVRERTRAEYQTQQAEIQRLAAVAAEVEASAERDNARVSLGRIFETRIWAALDQGRLASAARYALAANAMADTLPASAREELLGRYRSGLATAVYRLQRSLSVTDRGSSIAAIAQSGNGEVATLTEGGTLWLWRGARGGAISVPAHRSGSSILEFSPRGDLLVSASRTGELTLRDARTGETTFTLVAERDMFSLDPVRAAHFSPDGTRLAVSYDMSGASMWDTETGQLLYGFRGQSGQGLDLAFSPDGARIITTTWTTDPFVWDAMTGVRIAELPHPVRELRTVAYSPDGTLIATGGYQRVFLWNAATLELIATLPGHDGVVACLAFSPDSQMLATCAGGGARGAKLWTRSGQLVADLVLDGSWVGNVLFSPDSALLATTNAFGDARLWNGQTGALVAELLAHETPITSLAFSPDGRVLTTGSRDGSVRRWSTENYFGRVLLDVPTRQFGTVVYSPDGARIATSGYDNVVRLWDGNTGAPIAAMPEPIAPSFDNFYELAFSRDGALLASGSSHGDVRIFSSGDGAHLGTLPSRGLPDTTSWSVQGLAFLPDGDHIISVIGGVPLVSSWRDGRGTPATGSSWPADYLTFSTDPALSATSFRPDGEIEIRDMRTGRTLRTFAGPGERVRRLAFSSDRRLLASAHTNGTVRLLNTATGEVLLTLHVRLSEPEAVAFSYDNSRIAVGAESAVDIYDTESGRLLQSIPTATGGRNFVSALAFAPDGRHLAAGDADRGYFLEASALNATWPDLKAQLCTRLMIDAQRRFTEGEIDADPLIRDVWLVNGRSANADLCTSH